MAKFSKDYQPSNRGRPVGSKNKRSLISEVMTSEALEKLAMALHEGEIWAIQEILKRTHPTLKPITPENSLDGEFLRLKMLEISEFEQRIQALENRYAK